jgi:hypothetical protein
MECAVYFVSIRAIRVSGSDHKADPLQQNQQTQDSIFESVLSAASVAPTPPAAAPARRRPGIVCLCGPGGAALRAGGPTWSGPGPRRGSRPGGGRECGSNGFAHRSVCNEGCCFTPPVYPLWATFVHSLSAAPNGAVSALPHSWRISSGSPSFCVNSETRHLPAQLPWHDKLLSSKAISVNSEA